MNVIQNELNKIAREWNFYRVRKSKQAESPAGIPELLYHAPEIEGFTRYLYIYKYLLI